MLDLSKDWFEVVDEKGNITRHDILFSFDSEIDDNTYIVHTAPKEIVWRLGYYPDPHDIELTGYLEWVMYECQYERWFFGHFHEETLLDGKFRALYYGVEKIGDE